MIARSSLLHDDQELRVTVSIGGATFRPGDNLHELIDRVDAHLYMSNGIGPNQATIAE